MNNSKTRTNFKNPLCHFLGLILLKTLNAKQWYKINIYGTKCHRLELLTIHGTMSKAILEIALSDCPSRKLFCLFEPPISFKSRDIFPHFFSTEGHHNCFSFFLKPSRINSLALALQHFLALFLTRITHSNLKSLD